MEIGLNPIETDDGLMILTVIVDVSERVNAARALARSEAEFRASFEGATVGKILADPESRRILRANRALAGMLGYQPEDIVGRLCPEFIWHEDQAADAADHARLLSGEADTSAREERYIRRDGSPFWVRVSATVVRPPASGDRAIEITAIEDIDTQHKAEAALREAKRELEQVVEERTNALGQRDLLLREVYHRVKNNLQLVDSLLMMQGRKINDPQAKEALAEPAGPDFRARTRPPAIDGILGPEDVRRRSFPGRSVKEYPRRRRKERGEHRGGGLHTAKSVWTSRFPLVCW